MVYFRPAGFALFSVKRTVSLEYGAGKSDSENYVRIICFQLVLKPLCSLFTCRVIIESNADLMDFRVFGKIPLNRTEIPAAV